MVFCNLKTFTFKKIIIKYCDHSSILFSDDYFEACEEVKAIIKGCYMKNIGGVDGDGVDSVDSVDGVNDSNVLSVNSVDTVYSFSSEDLGLTKPLAL